MKKHGERAHSKFSASGAERWFNCPGSVALSEGLPDKSSPWAEEGTKAHEVLEAIMKGAIAKGIRRVASSKPVPGVPEIMLHYCASAANFILDLHATTKDSDVLVENKVYLDFIHPEMFGTYDGAVVDHFDTLHVFDFKYGAGHAVSVKENLQMIFYAIGLAHKYHWNFKTVRLWIIQPRIKGYDGPTFWEIPIAELRRYVDKFQNAVDRVLKNPSLYQDGSWCHWCKAKPICPLKRENKNEKAANIFASEVKGNKQHGKQEENVKKEESSGKEEKTRRRKSRNREQTLHGREENDFY